MRFLWIAALVIACRSALPPPTAVVVVPPPVVVVPPPVCVVAEPSPPLRCDASCAGTMNRAPGPGDCDGCPAWALGPGWSWHR